jgi:hypothetical protein
MVPDGETPNPRYRVAVLRALMLVFAIYLAACLAPAVSASDGSKADPGWRLLLCGWVCIAWWSNVLFFLGCAFLYDGHPSAAMTLAVLASIVGLSTYGFVGGLFGAVRVGFYLWELSFVVLACSCIPLRRISMTGGNKPSPPVADLA